MPDYILTVIVFLPLVAAALIVLFPRPLSGRPIWLVALAATVLDLALAAWTFASYDRGGAQFQFVHGPFRWVPALNINYAMAVDGISAPLVLLTALLGVVAVLASHNVTQRPKEYFAWLLLLQTAVGGVFAAQDLVLFLVFWEIELVPMYFLIAQWGTGRREYSAMKFLVFTFLGSAFMLVAIVAVYLSTDPHSFDMMTLAQQGLPAKLVVPAGVLFWFFLICFAIKLPSVPVHTWLPDAHTDAPTAVSVMLAGVLLKMGGYGLIRFNLTLFPEQAAKYAWVLAVLGVVSIIYGAIITIRQTDLKRLVAYSSVSHMGIVMLGLSAVAGRTGAPALVGLTGAALQLFTHGTITGMLFLMVGQIYDRTHTRHIPDLRSLASRMPFIATMFLFAGLASLGLPGLSGFVAEVMVFLGAFAQRPWFGGVAILTTVLTAAYILFMTQRVLFGPRMARWDELADASPVEWVAPALLAVAILAVGVYPRLITDVLTEGLTPVASLFG